MRMEKGSRSDRIQKQEKRTAAKLRLERRKKRVKRGITTVIPEGGTGYGKMLKATWKTSEPSPS